MTNRRSFGHTSPAAGVPAVGFSSPVESGHEPLCVSNAAFLRLGVPIYGRPGRGAARLAGALSGLLTRSASPTPFSSGRRLNRLNEREHTMKTSTSRRSTAKSRTTASPLAAPLRHYFSAQIIDFASRPRLKVGDVAEMCRDALSCNHGKRVIVTGFDEKGFVEVRSLSAPLYLVDMNTGQIDPVPVRNGRTQPNNLYRLSSYCTKKGFRHD